MSHGAAHLVAFEPKEQSCKYILRKHDVFLDRSGKGDLRLLDVSVSREHARVILDKGHWTIRDLQSANGTYLDGNAVTKETLRSGDEIALGIYKLRFMSPSETSGASESAETSQSAELSTRIFVLDKRVPQKLARAAKREGASLATIADEGPLGRIVGSTDHIREVTDLIRSAAQSMTPVLVRGETGTGKELVAQAIAKLSPNRKPYAVAVNMAAVDPGLAAAELFGHKRGAVTGADRDRMGVIELAEGGTLFLDEVGNAPFEVQSVLLRVLETGEVMGVGTRKVRRVNVRVVAATNRDLKEMMEQGQFSDALYYRLSQFEIRLQPLRDRRDDILLLARNFLETEARPRGISVPHLSNHAAAMLWTYQWPGNVRELKGCMEYVVAVTKTNDITPSCLPTRVLGGRHIPTNSTLGGTFGAARRALLVDALRQTGGNQSQAARILGVSRQAVHQMIRRLGFKRQNGDNR